MSDSALEANHYRVEELEDGRIELSFSSKDGEKFAGVFSSYEAFLVGSSLLGVSSADMGFRGRLLMFLAQGIARDATRRYKKTS